MIDRGYAVVGRPQATRCFQHAHGGRNVTHRNAWNHGSGSFCVDLGAVGQQACIQGNKLLGSLRLTPQQRRADLGATVDLQDDVWQLRRANGFAQELVRAAQLWLFLHGPYGRDPDRTGFIDFEQPFL